MTSLPPQTTRLDLPAGRQESGRYGSQQRLPPWWKVEWLPFPLGAKEHCICPTIGARVVPTRSSSIREDRFIKTFQGIPAFAGAAAWDKPRSIG